MTTDNPRAAEVKAALAAQAIRGAHVEFLDHTKFLTETGEVDTDKVTAYAATVAAARDGMGGGGRGTTDRQTGREAGKAEALKRFGGGGR